MAPSLETLGGAVNERRSFAVALDAPEVLDLNGFDDWASSIGEIKGLVTELKWIVRGDRWIVFDPKYQHKDFNAALTHEGNKDPLNAAGDLNILRLRGEIAREITGWSITLAEVLSKRQSDTFMRDTLLGKLGQGFKIPEDYR